MANVKQADFYTAVFSNWSKALGPKPTNEQLATISPHFARPGKQALVLAMALRPDGVTSAQMMNASALFDGKATPHRNKLKAQCDAGMFERDTSVTGYKIKLTARGAAIIKRNAEGAAAKATDKVKAKAATLVKAKAKKAPSKPRKVTEAPPVGDGAAVEASPAQ